MSSVVPTKTDNKDSVVDGHMHNTLQTDILRRCVQYISSTPDVQQKLCLCLLVSWTACSLAALSNLWFPCDLPRCRKQHFSQQLVAS